MENITQTSASPGAPGTSTVDLTGKTLGDYQVLRKLGQGGMGQVYLAEQQSLKRKVALKLLRPELAANETALKRFKQEAEAVARVTHANIVQVYAIGEAEGQHFMALEYVEGRNLRDFIARKGPPELLLALSIMRQVASALQRASELGIIHRDIKPENILLTKKGEVKVADFGLSRVLEGEQPAVHLTQSGVTMGTPLYMSPEQVEGKPVDHRTDIYSLGVSCYHMFAGEPPFRGSTAFEVALQHVRAEPAPLASIRSDLPAEVCAVVHKMMAKDPAQRYQTGRDLLKDVAVLRESLTGNTGFIPVLSTGPIDQAPSVPAQGLGSGLQTGVGRALQTMPQSGLGSGSSPRSGLQTIPRPRRHRWLVVLFLVSVLCAGTAGAVFAWLQQKDRSPSDAEGDPVNPRPAVESTPQGDREQMLKKLVDGYLNPSEGFANSKTGVQVCLDLGVSYLDNHRLDEAEALFKRLEGVHQVEQYHMAGRLGHGIVLAMRDDWQSSHQTFLSLQKDRKKPGDAPRSPILGELVRSNGGFARCLKEAVHRNEINSKGEVDQTMPNYLRFLSRREPPKPGDRRPGDRPPPKKPDPPTMPE